jgi:hypothetical protein
MIPTLQTLCLHSIQRTLEQNEPHEKDLPDELVRLLTTIEHKGNPSQYKSMRGRVREDAWPDWMWAKILLDSHYRSVYSCTNSFVPRKAPDEYCAPSKKLKLDQPALTETD